MVVHPVVKGRGTCLHVTFCNETPDVGPLLLWHFGFPKKERILVIFFRTRLVTWFRSDSASIFMFPLKSLAKLPRAEQGCISSKACVVVHRSDWTPWGLSILTTNEKRMLYILKTYACLSPEPLLYESLKPGLWKKIQRETFWIILTTMKLVHLCRAVVSGKCWWQQKLHIAKVWLEIRVFHHWGLWEKTSVSSVSWGSSMAVSGLLHSCQVKGEISQCMGASPVPKSTKDSFFWCSSEGDGSFVLWLERFQEILSFRMDFRICSAQLGWDFNLTLSLGCSIFATSLCSVWIYLAGPMQPQTAYDYTCACYSLCPSTTNPYFYLLHQIYTQGSFSSEQSLWGLGELGTSLKFYEICYVWSTKLISQFLPNFSNKLSHIYCSWVFLINSKYRCSCSWREKSVFLIWITLFPTVLR